VNIGIEKKKTTGDCEKIDSRKMRSLRVNDKDLDSPVLCASGFGDVRFSGIRFSQSPGADDGVRQVFARHKLLPNAARLIKCAVIHYRFHSSSLSILWGTDDLEIREA
jgi:hypothetical protein